MQLPSKNDLFSVYQQVSSKVKQYAKNLTPMELKVEEATSNEPWGPHGTTMAGMVGQEVSNICVKHVDIGDVHCLQASSNVSKSLAGFNQAESKPAAR